MTKEFKFVSLAEFKVASEGSGSFEGYASVFHILDDVGDIVIKGCYADTLPQFLERGFTAQSHEWSVTGVIGYPVKAYEDDYGLFVRSEFHSDPQSQVVRTKIQERMAAKKRVSLSIGYEPSATPILIYPKDYQSEIPKYVAASVLEETLQKAARFPRVRILPKLNLFEHSVVPAPALQEAVVTQVKSADPTGKAAPTPDVKGMFEEELANRTNNLYVFGSVLWDVIYRLQELAAGMVGTGLTFDLPAMLDEALSEYVERVRTYVLADIATYGDGSMDFTGAETAAAVKRALADGTTFAAHLEAVVDAATSVVERAQKRAQTRREEKEGRTISAATADKLRSLLDRIEEMRPLLTELLDAALPKDKDEEKGLDPAIQAELIRILQRDANRRGVPVT